VATLVQIAEWTTSSFRKIRLTGVLAFRRHRMLALST